MRPQMFGWRGGSAMRPFARRRGPSSRGLKCLQNGGPRGLLERSANAGGGRGGGVDAIVGVFEFEDDGQGH